MQVSQGFTNKDHSILKGEILINVKILSYMYLCTNVYIYLNWFLKCSMWSVDPLFQRNVCPIDKTVCRLLVSRGGVQLMEVNKLGVWNKIYQCNVELVYT